MKKQEDSPEFETLKPISTISQDILELVQEHFKGAVKRSIEAISRNAACLKE